MFAPDLVHRSTVGATTAERNALLNASTHVWIVRDQHWIDGSTVWQVLHSNCDTFPGGFKAHECKTRAEAIEYANERFPNLSVKYQHGDKMKFGRPISRALHEAICEGNAIRNAKFN